MVLLIMTQPQSLRKTALGSERAQLLLLGGLVALAPTHSST